MHLGEQLYVVAHLPLVFSVWSAEFEIDDNYLLLVHHDAVGAPFFCALCIGVVAQDGALVQNGPPVCKPWCYAWVGQTLMEQGKKLLLGNNVVIEHTCFFKRS